MKRKLFVSTAALLALSLLVGCAAPRGDRYESYPPNYAPDYETGETGEDGNYVYDAVIEQGEKDTSAEPSSYFSLDCNTANYSQVRAQINAGVKIAADSVRTEELINYFSYDYPAPEGEVGVTAYLAPCPWNAAHKLITIGVRTEERKINSDRNNYVFLVDVSGSMLTKDRNMEMTRIELVQYGLQELTKSLDANDYVSIVTYASGVKEVLEPTPATEAGKAEIVTAVNNLRAGGSTNGSGGLELAYENAQKYYAEGGNNRVILLSDGDFNVGISSTQKLETFIAEKAEGGVYLSVLGVGFGNMRDDFMQTLALRGNGNYGFIDTPREAKRILSEQLSSTLIPVAKDAKAGVTFDADMVSTYRMLGYDMKTMSEDDFNDPSKDAGEIGSNLTVTALYEIALKEGAEGKLGEVEVRYKSVETEEQKSVKAEISSEPSTRTDAAFAACVAEFGLVLRNSKYKGEASLASVLERLEGIAEYVAADEYRVEFKDLVQKAAASEYYD